MSIEDLKRLGVTEIDENASSPAQSGVRPFQFLTTALAAVAGCILIWAGDGSLWTWLGLLGFSLGFGLFILVNLGGVDSGG